MSLATQQILLARYLREPDFEAEVRARPAQVADTVAQALSTEQDTRLLPAYVEYFATSVREHDLAARTLLTLIGERLDWQDTRRLVQARPYQAEQGFVALNLSHLKRGGHATGGQFFPAAAQSCSLGNPQDEL